MEPAVTAATESALTDDELAALSYRAGQRWRAALPTVDPDDADDLGAAVFRGGRSLLARGLMQAADEEPVLEESLADLVETGLYGDVRVSAYTGDATLNYDASGFAYLNYSRPGSLDVLVEIVDSVGLHRFGALDAAEAARALIELVTAVHDGSETELGAVGDTLCLALPAADTERTTVYAVRPGVVETAAVTPEDLLEVSGSQKPLRDTQLATLVAAVSRAYGR